jgi:hypothetical protein
LFRLPDLDTLILTTDFFAFEMWLMASVADQQGMLTPPRHLIPLLVRPGICVCPIFRICIPYGFMRLIPVRFIILSAKHSVHWEFFDFILSF